MTSEQRQARGGMAPLAAFAAAVLAIDPATGSARVIPWMRGIPTPVAYLPGP